MVSAESVSRATSVRVYFIVSILCSSAFLGPRCQGAIYFLFTTLSLFVLLLACLHSSLFTLFCFLCCSRSCLFLLLTLHLLFLLSFFQFPFCFPLLFSSCANRFCSSFTSNALIHSGLVRTLALAVLVRLS